MSTNYFLPIEDARLKRLARGWLWLGILALIGSGLLAVLLVFSRTPGLQNWPPIAHFFHVALVVHVDLSVLVWFVSVAGVLWSLNGRSLDLTTGKDVRGVLLAYAAPVTAALGTLLMIVSPFIGRGGPVMANYIPVLQDPIFFSGLMLFGLGAALLVLHSIINTRRLFSPIDGTDALRIGLALSLIPAAIAFIAFAWSYFTMPVFDNQALTGKAYYEILFWGGGHALQFIWTTFLLVAWLWLASACGANIPMSPRIAVLAFFLASICSLAIPIAYLIWPIYTVEHRNLITFAMGLGGGLAILPVAIAVVIGMHRNVLVAEAARPLRAALYSSLLLFCFGGLIGFMIAGNNVKIPAHYHGCIVGVTLALMGLIYHLLPKLGYGIPSCKPATFSSYCYAVGQAMHIGGLMWSGGYGVQRKVAGAEQVLRSTGEVVAMGFMGLGGLIAIIGGLVFVVVVLKAIWVNRKTRANNGANNT